MVLTLWTNNEVIIKRIEFFDLDPNKDLNKQSESLIKMHDFYNVDIADFKMVVVKDEKGKDKIVLGILVE